MTPNGNSVDFRDQQQWRILAEHSAFDQELLSRAWQDPNRGPQRDLAAILVSYGVLSPEQGQSLRQHSRFGQPPPSHQTLAVSSPVHSTPHPQPTKNLARLAQVGGQLGPYTLVSELGMGGMGQVFEATHDGLAEPVALKILPLGQASERTRERFEIEGQTMLRLRHPNIVRVMDLKVDAELSYIALELVRGGSLQDRLKEKGTLPVEEVMNLGALLGDALQYAHERGVIHRDMKPGNVLLQDGETPVITDFGLAKEVESHDRELTRSGEMLGTPGYMAPEQIESAAFVDGRADIYGLGVTLFACLIGKLPIERNTTLELIAAVLTADAPPLRSFDSTMPVDVETILSRCLAREPERRYTTAAELAADCRRVLSKEPIQAKPVGLRERLDLWQRRHSRQLVLGVFLLLLLMGAGAIIAVQKSEAESSRRAEKVALEAKNEAEAAREKAQRARRLAESEQKRAEAEQERAEKEKKRAEKEARRAEASLEQTRRVKDKLQTSQNELVTALEQSRINVCRAYVERTRGELLTGSYNRSAIYAAEALGRAKTLKGPKARETERYAAARLRSSLFHNPLLWRRDPPFRFAATMSASNTKRWALGAKRRILVWDAESGRAMRSIPCGLRQFQCIALSPDGQWLAIGEEGSLSEGSRTAVEDAKILVHSLKESDTKKSLRGFRGGVLALGYGQEQLWSLSIAGDLWLWGAGDKVVKKLTVTIPAGVKKAQFSKDGSCVALLHKAGVQVISTKDASSIVELNRPAHFMDINHDGSLILLSDLKGQVVAFNRRGGQIWDFRGRRRCRGIIAPGEGLALIQVGTRVYKRDLLTGRSKGSIESIQVGQVFAAGERVIISQRSGQWLLYDFEKNKIEGKASRPLSGLKVEITGQELRYGDSVLDLETGRFLRESKRPGNKRVRGQSNSLDWVNSKGVKGTLKAPGLIQNVTSSPNGRFLVLSGPKALRSREYWVGVWDELSFQKIGESWETKTQAKPAIADNAWVSYYVSLGTLRGKVVVRDAQKNELVAECPVSGRIYSYTLSPDGQWLAIFGPPPFGLRLRRTLSKGAWTKIVEANLATRLVFSPDSKTLAFTSVSNDIALYQLSTKRIKRRLTGHRDSVYRLTFSPDGLRLVSVAQGMRCWDLNDKDELEPLTFDETVKVLGGSDDGTRIAALLGDRFIILDQTGKPCLSRDRIGSLAFGLNDQQAYLQTRKGVEQVNLLSGKTEKNYALEGGGTVVSPDRIFRYHRSCVVSAPISGPFSVTKSLPVGVVIRCQLAVDREGKRCAVVDGRAVTVLDGQTLKLIWREDLEGRLGRAYIRSGVWRGKHLLLSTSTAIWKMDGQTGRVLSRIELDSSSGLDTCISPDGQVLAALTKDQQLALWDTETGTRFLLSARGPLVQTLTRAFTFSRGGRYLFVHEEKKLRRFDTQRVRKALNRPLPEDPQRQIQERLGLILEGYRIRPVVPGSFVKTK